VIKLNVNGTAETFEDTSLESMQQAVGGRIQIIRFGSQEQLMVLDEEGKLKNKPINKVATLLANIHGDYIVGDVLIAEDGEIE